MQLFWSERFAIYMFELESQTSWIVLWKSKFLQFLVNLNRIRWSLNRLTPVPATLIAGTFSSINHQLLHLGSNALRIQEVF